MKKILFVLLILPMLNGCNESAKASSNSDDLPEVTCSGFISPGINAFVRDSLTEEIVDSALVQIYIEDDANTIMEAEYIPSDDQLSNSETFAYYALMDVNLSEYEYGIVVSESNYNTHVSKNLPFKLNTGCMADNRIKVDIYLCELGSACL